MIARMWRGWVRSELIDEYVDIVERTGMAGYRATPGNQGASSSLATSAADAPS